MIIFWSTSTIQPLSSLKRSFPEVALIFLHLLSTTIHFPAPKEYLRYQRTYLRIKDINPNKAFALAEIDTLMMEIADFYRESDFQTFFEAHRPVYRKSIDEVLLHLPAQDFISFMESYFGEGKTSYHFIVVPFFKAEYGQALQIINGEEKHLFCIVSPFGPQVIEPGGKVLEAGFASKEGVQEWSVHEYAHLFINPWIDKEENRLVLNHYSHLYESIENHPEIGNWYAFFAEHLAVAFEVRAAELMGDQERKRALLEKHKGWPYLNHFVGLLKTYESNRAVYPSFGSYMPDLVASLENLE